MDTRSLKTMSDEECKNLVYLMIRRYANRWETDFPKDMNISEKDCHALYDGYSSVVLAEIDAENKREHDEAQPTVDEIIRRGMRRLMDTIEKGDDPSKVARAIEIVSSLPDENAFKRERRKTIFEAMQEKAKNL